MNAPLELICSSQFLLWLDFNRLSLAVSTYQTNRLFLVGLKPDGRLSTFERLYERAMGLYVQGDQLYLSTRYQLWQLGHDWREDEPYDGSYDRLYIPRRSYVTGDLDVHDVVVSEVDGQSQIVFVNTLFSCLATVSDRHSFRVVWQPPFISKLVPEDRCHLNGLAVVEGKARYVTVVSTSDVVGGWRDRRHDSGCIFDIESNERVAGGLSMPHSPRWYRGRLYVLNSGTGEFGTIDLESGRFEAIAFCPGYLRGLAFYGDYALVGLSQPRHNRSFRGLALGRVIN